MLSRTDAATVADQVREVATLMASGLWVVGVTENEIANKWNVGVATVRDRAAEARRLVGHAFGDLEELRGLVLAQLQGIAIETRKFEPRTAVAALMAIANVAGLVVTKHVDTRPQGASSGKHLTPTEKRAEIARIRAALDEAEETAAAEEITATTTHVLESGD